MAGIHSVTRITALEKRVTDLESLIDHVIAQIDELTGEGKPPREKPKAHAKNAGKK